MSDDLYIKFVHSPFDHRQVGAIVKSDNSGIAALQSTIHYEDNKDDEIWRYEMCEIYANDMVRPRGSPTLVLDYPSDDSDFMTGKTNTLTASILSMSNAKDWISAFVDRHMMASRMCSTAFFQIERNEALANAVKRILNPSDTPEVHHGTRLCRTLRTLDERQDKYELSTWQLPSAMSRWGVVYTPRVEYYTELPYPSRERKPRSVSFEFQMHLTHLRSPQEGSESKEDQVGSGSS